MWLSQILTDEWSAAGIAGAGAWGVALARTLSRCYTGQVCRTHKLCRRCIMYAASIAMSDAAGGSSIVLASGWIVDGRYAEKVGAAIMLVCVAQIPRREWRALSMMALRRVVRGLVPFARDMLGSAAYRFGRQDDDAARGNDQPNGGRARGFGRSRDGDGGGVDKPADTRHREPKAAGSDDDEADKTDDAPSTD